MKTILVRANLMFNDELFTFCSTFHCSVCPVSNNKLLPICKIYYILNRMTLLRIPNTILFKKLHVQNFTFHLFSFIRMDHLNAMHTEYWTNHKTNDFMFNIINTIISFLLFFALPVNGVASWIMLHVS